MGKEMTYGYLGRFTPWEEIWQAIEQLVRKCKISLSALICREVDPSKVFDLELHRKQAAAGYRATNSGAIKILPRP
jgi:hypothetical protein